MVIHGKHKRFELAEKHRRQLERKYGKCKILSRRNKAGEDSPRGHSYRFQVPNQNRKYVIVLKYKTRKKKDGKIKIVFKDLVITYRSGANQEEIMDWIDSGRADEIPVFVFESEIVKFTKGEFVKGTKNDWDWQIRNHRGEPS